MAETSSNNKFVPILVVLLIVASFLIGSLYTQVNLLKKGVGTATTTTTGTPQAQQQPAAQKINLDQIKNVFKQDVIRFGDASKKVLLVEIVDPSCPFCHVASGKNAALNKQMGGQFTLAADGGTYVAPVPEFKKLVDQGKASLAVVYARGHGNGDMGMKALYCAQDMGKFWEVHDALFSSTGYDLQNNQVKNDKTKSQEVADFLKSVADAGTMKACLDSGKYDNRLDNDVKLSSSLGVSGTPGFFVNDQNFAGAYSYKDMESVVTTALK